MFDPSFDNGVDTLRKTLGTRQNLPEPRPIVNLLFDNCRNEDGNRNNSPNMGAVMFGQLITHDVSLQVAAQRQKGGYGITCCTKDGKGPLPANLTHPDCIPIKVPQNDPRLPNRGCMNFLRTQDIVSNDCELTPRLQTNQQTSFIDLSNVYGATADITKSIRKLQNGLINLDSNNVLPVDGSNDFILADVRINQTPILALLHSLHYRQHNRYASIIKLLQPLWDDNTIFEEARRFTIAVHQHIVWNEWVPVFHGRHLQLLNIIQFKFIYFFID